MYTETEGIILKQTKIAGGRKMLVLFSKKYGKISAGTSANAKNRSALATRPFTHGRYDLYKSRDTYHINSSEVIKAYYGIGEDIDKYMCASYILELTEKLLPENAPDANLFKLLLDFFDIMESRKKAYMTVVTAFELKAMQYAGVAPEINRCVFCGKEERLSLLGVKEGGVICEDCRNNMDSSDNELIYDINFDIIRVLHYFFKNNIKSIERVALDDSLSTNLRRIIKAYMTYHLCIKELKSEEFLKI